MKTKKHFNLSKALSRLWFGRTKAINSIPPRDLNKSIEFSAFNFRQHRTSPATLHHMGMEIITNK